jgi:type IV secretory pathway component VirB8
MENNKTSSRERHRSRSRKPRKLDAASLIKLLRRHGTLTLVVCVVAVSLLTGYIAIELGA